MSRRTRCEVGQCKHTMVLQKVLKLTQKEEHNRTFYCGFTLPIHIKLDKSERVFQVLYKLLQQQKCSCLALLSGQGLAIYERYT